jgi:hypothetical protein
VRPEDAERNLSISIVICRLPVLQSLRSTLRGPARSPTLTLVFLKSIGGNA